MRTPYDFGLLSRSSVGFDRLFDLINQSAQSSEPQDAHTPPYDISRSGEDRYRITLAIAGFSPKEITVTAQQNLLVIAGNKAARNDVQYLYQGIPAESFERQFSLADYVEVEGASFENGLLHIELIRRIPEKMKARKIEISAGGPQVSAKIKGGE